MKIGLIGIIHQELEQDFFGALAKVAAIGYRGLEFGGSTLERVGLPVSETRRRMADLGLEIVNFHMGVYSGPLTADFAGTVRLAQAAGCRYLTVSWGPVESAEQVRRDAARYDELGRRYRAEGLQLLYHNHDHELAVFDGRHALDLLLENSDPAHLQAQLDVCWLRYGGVDPAACLRKWAGRAPLIHLKDLVRLEPGCETASASRDLTRFTEVGTGIIDFEAVFAAAGETGVEWGCVEQDRPRCLSPFESITCSYLNLKARGLV